MIIPLVPALLTGSSNLPGSFGRAVLSSAVARLRGLRRDIAPLFGLAPCGVLPAICLTADAVRSYRTFSPLPLDSALRASLGASSRACLEQGPKGRVERRYIFCATFLQVTLTGRYPAHCPAEFGLSSPTFALTRYGRDDRLARCDPRLYYAR